MPDVLLRGPGSRPEQEAAAAGVPQRPLLRPGYRLTQESGRLLLEHGHRVVIFEGRAATTLLPLLLSLLDGTRRCEDIAAAVGPATAPAVAPALGQLAARGLLCEGPAPTALPRPLRDTVEMLASGASIPPIVVAGRLAEGPLAIVGSSGVAAQVAALVEAAGLDVERPRRWRDARGALVLAAPAPAEAGALRRLNRRLLRRGTPWLPVLPYDGRILAVGPLIVPGETACFTCYLLRRAAAVDYAVELLALEKVAVAARSTQALDGLAAEVAVMQALRWIGTRDARLPGMLQTVELSDGVELSRHAVLRVPRCPSCSGLTGVAAPLPWFDVSAEAA